MGALPPRLPILLPPSDNQNDAKKQRPWAGGVNLTALDMLEQRAYGSYHYMLNNTPSDLGPVRDRIALNYTTSGTAHGLSKMPYLRDSRRALGVDNYRFPYWPMDYQNASEPCVNLFGEGGRDLKRKKRRSHPFLLPSSVASATSSTTRWPCPSEFSFHEPQEKRNKKTEPTLSPTSVAAHCSVWPVAAFHFPPASATMMTSTG